MTPHMYLKIGVEMHHLIINTEINGAKILLDRFYLKSIQIRCWSH